MRILICDDDIIIVEQIKKHILDYFFKNHLKSPEIVCFSNGEALLLDTGSQDILFLDIEMPGMNGIYIGNELKKKNPDIIIMVVTSYMEYLDEAMRFHVFRYLSKPIDKHRLQRNLKDALKSYSSSTKKIAIETKNGVSVVREADIICVEASGRRVYIHTSTCDYESIHPIQYWSDVLRSNYFFQSHRSYIVNFMYIDDFGRDLIHLHNNTFHAYLTRRKYTAFKDAYFLYLESMR